MFLPRSAVVYACRYRSESCEAEVVQGTSLIRHTNQNTFGR